MRVELSQLRHRLSNRVALYFDRGPIRRASSVLFSNVGTKDIPQLASAMAFDLFLALIPLLGLAGWAVSTVLQGDSHAMENLSRWLDLAPADVKEVVNIHADRFMRGAIAPVVVAGALWLASGAFHGVMVAFERTLPSNPRAWWVRRGIALLCVLGFLGSLSLGAWVSVHLAGGPNYVVERVSAMLVSGSAVHLEASDSAKFVGLLISALTITLLIAAFFRIGVRRDVRKRHVWPGTFLTLSLAATSSYLFGLYARSLARYALYYGSLAAVAVVLAWLWMCSLALLLGAELNAYLEEEKSPP